MTPLCRTVCRAKNVNNEPIWEAYRKPQHQIVFEHNLSCVLWEWDKIWSMVKCGWLWSTHKPWTVCITERLKICSTNCKRFPVSDHDLQQDVDDALSGGDAFFCAEVIFLKRLNGRGWYYHSHTVGSHSPATTHWETLACQSEAVCVRMDNRTGLSTVTSMTAW